MVQLERAREEAEKRAKANEEARVALIAEKLEAAAKTERKRAQEEEVERLRVTAELEAADEKARTDQSALAQKVALEDEAERKKQA